LRSDGATGVRALTPVDRYVLRCMKLVNSPSARRLPGDGGRANFFGRAVDRFKTNHGDKPASRWQHSIVEGDDYAHFAVDWGNILSTEPSTD
jgi:hypothetical protein